MSTAEEPGSTPAFRLRDDFPPVDIDAWRREVDRLLKGAPFEKSLVSALPEGLRIQPLHTAADLADGWWGASAPGQAPFLRGARTGTTAAVPWLIAQELPAADPVDGNLALLHDLERGQSAINLKLDLAGRRGLDAATAPGEQVGSGGTAIADLADLRRALASVDLTACPLLLQAGAATLPVAAMLAALAGERGAATHALTGAWGCDPLAVASMEPAPALPVGILFDHAAQLTRWGRAQAPSLRTLAVTDAVWHEAGADGVLSLGLALAGGIETLREMERRGLTPEDCAPRLAFHLSLDTDFFLEIARLRALRVLWSDVLVAAGCDAPASAAWIHARTGDRMLARLDPQTNLLRATTAAMAAVCAGVDSLHVTPWDALMPESGGVGRRLARNLQLILGHECRFGTVVDPAGGSWYVEQLTRAAGEGAWTVMQRIEAAGGLGAALASGLVQSLVGEASRARAARVAGAREVRVGVNRFCPARAGGQVGTPVDAAWLAARRAAAVAVPTDVAPVDVGGDAVAQMAGLGAAAARGATIGALATALGGAAALPPPWLGLAPRRDAEPFEGLVDRARRLAAQEPSLASVHCLCLGDAGRTGPRLDFARGSLAAGGFSVSAGAFHQTVDTAVAEARASRAAVVMLVGLDETYPELGAAVAARLSAATGGPLLMAAGRPSASTEPLTRAGVTRYLHLGSDLVVELGGVLDTLGGAA